MLVNVREQTREAVIRAMSLLGTAFRERRDPTLETGCARGTNP